MSPSCCPPSRCPAGDRVADHRQLHGAGHAGGRRLPGRRPAGRRRRARRTWGWTSARRPGRGRAGGDGPPGRGRAGGGVRADRRETGHGARGGAAVGGRRCHRCRCSPPSWPSTGWSINWWSATPAARRARFGAVLPHPGAGGGRAGPRGAVRRVADPPGRGGPRAARDRPGGRARGDGPAARTGRSAAGADRRRTGDTAALLRDLAAASSSDRHAVGRRSRRPTRSGTRWR